MTMTAEPFIRIPVGNAPFIIAEENKALAPLDHASTYEEALAKQRQLQDAADLAARASAARTGSRFDPKRVPRIRVFQRPPDMWEIVPIAEG